MSLDFEMTGEMSVRDSNGLLWYGIGHSSDIVKRTAQSMGLHVQGVNTNNPSIY